MVIAIDTGGTKTLIAGFSNSGELVSKARIPTPKDTYEYLSTVNQLIHESFGEQLTDGQAYAIVIAAPGIIKDGIVVWAQNLKWQNFNIKTEFTKAFPNIPIYVENDANLAGLFESQHEPIEQTVMYLTVSTGIGAGVTVNRQIDKALERIEPGRIILDYSGEKLEWEQFASGRAIVETYKKNVSEIEDPAIWDDVAERISYGLAIIVPLIQPDKIIFGGSVGVQFNKYSNRLAELLEAKLPTNIPCPELKQAVEPDDAVIYGCYQLAKDELN